jgi:uncharacterized protein
MLYDNSHLTINLLRDDLLNARKKRDSLTSSVLQSVIAAIDNAGAVPVSADLHGVGAGSTEASRRELSNQDIRDIIRSEISEMQQAVKEFGNANSDLTDELGKKITILENYLGTTYDA